MNNGSNTKVIIRFCAKSKFAYWIVMARKNHVNAILGGSFITEVQETDTRGIKHDLEFERARNSINALSLPSLSAARLENNADDGGRVKML